MKIIVKRMAWIRGKDKFDIDILELMRWIYFDLLALKFKWINASLLSKVRRNCSSRPRESSIIH